MLAVNHLTGFGAVEDPVNASAVAGYSIMAPNSGGYGALMCTGIVLEYSDDDFATAGVTVDTAAGLTFTDVEKKTRMFTPPSSKHRYWRWTFTGGGGSWEIGELELLNAAGVDIMPTMTALTTSGVTVTGSHDVANAFVAFGDSNTAAGATWWGALSTASVTMKVDYGVAV